MTTVVSTPVSDRPRPYVSAWDIWFLLTPLLAMSPLLLVEAQKLMNRPERQFFPLLILVALYFPAMYVLKHHPTARQSVPRDRLVWALILFASGILIYIAGAWIFSPWLAHVAALAVFLGWAIGRCVELPWSVPVGWTGLLLVTLPLPFTWDQDFINWLQTASSSACADALDALGIANVRTANTIEIQGQKLFVEEACSGIGSMYALLAAAALLLVINHRPFLCSVLVLMSVPIWAMFGNFLRLLSIALAQVQFGRDLSHGLDHDLLGVMTFSLAALGLWMTDWLISGFLQPVPPTTPEYNVAFQTLNSALCWPGTDPFASGQDLEEESSAARVVEYAKPTIQPVDRPVSTIQVNPWQNPFTRVAIPIVSIVALVFGAMTAVVVAKSPSEAFSYGLPAYSEQELERFPGEQALPEMIGAWRRAQFGKETRSIASMFGTHSHIWEYRRSELRCLASLDFPFRGEHPLRVCYAATGWTIERATQIKDKATPRWDWQEIVMENEFGMKGFVCYCTIAADSQPYNLLDAVAPASLLQRVQHSLSATPMVNRAVFLPVCYQIQIMCETGSKLDEQDKSELRDLFFAVRERIRESLQTKN